MSIESEWWIAAWWIVIFFINWAFFVVLVEALVELGLTASPLEPIRAWFARKSGFIAELLSCGYCFSVWVAFAVAWILPSPLSLIIQFGYESIFLNFVEQYLWWFVNGVILHRLSNVFHMRIIKGGMIDVFAGDDDES